MEKSNKDLRTVEQNYTYFSMVSPKFKIIKKQSSNVLDQVKIVLLLGEAIYI